MSLQSCVADALESGRITKEEADKLTAISDVDEKQIIKGAIEDKLLKRRQTALQTLLLDKAIKDARSHGDGLSTGVMSLIVRDITGKANYSNIDARGKGIFGDFQRELTDMLDEYRTKLGGLTQNRQGARNMVKELYGEASGDANAKVFGEAWAKVSEKARIRFNRAGGNIKKKKGWRLPQHHDPLMLERAGFDKWYSDIENLIDPLTDSSGRALSRAESKEILQDSWNAIRTGGASRINPGTKGGVKMANRQQQERVFEFKDANSWLKYQDDYGTKDIFTMTQDHLRGMSQNIATLEVLGPNPNSAFKFLQDLQAKEGIGANKRQFQAQVFREQTGIGSLENIGRVASVLGGVRNVLNAAMLGGAWVSAWSDTFFTKLSANFLGLPTGKIFKRMAKNFVGSKEGRKDAVRMGLVAEAWMSRSLGANRYTEVFGKGITAKMSDFVMRASLLAPWTEAGRTAFGMEFTSHFAGQVGKRFGELSDPLQNALKRAGMGDADWDVIRKAQLTDIDGVGFLASEAIQGLNIPQQQRDDLSARYMGMILQEADIAVPIPGARERALASLGTQKGTLIGELTRTGIMFKSFPVTLATTHLYRGAMMNKLDRVSYIASLFVGTTAIGALSLQVKDMLKGKNPRDMSDPRFIAAAATQGGGFTLLGDFFFSDQNRFGGGLTSSLGGPALGLVDDVARLTVGNLQQAAKGEDTNFAGEAIKVAARYTPGSSLWYTRLAVERAIIDQLALLADPKIKRKFRNAMKRQRKDYGSDYWWSPGKAKPKGLPKLERAIGE